jgi:superfamily I DNA and RNA helicase
MDVIRGAYDKPVSTQRLIKDVEKIYDHEGTLYTGYPIISAIESSHSIDAVLVTPTHGMVLFDIVEEAEISDRQEIRDALYNSMVSRLINIKDLSAGRGGLSFDLSVVTYAPAWPKANIIDFKELVISKEQLSEFLAGKANDKNKASYNKVLAAIQALTKLKQRPPRRTKVKDSKGAILNELEKSISNLDRNQSKAVIETSQGIQRIRGLAGSGKTVILALKAAYLHSKNPDWKIGVTFYSRALKNQFRELITKFTIEQKNEEPDWEKIKLMQAWGSPSVDGFYYHFCKLNNADYHTFDSAKHKFNTDQDLLGKIANEAIANVTEPHPDFDVILIDEAQDFSESFLQLCYRLLKPSDINNDANRRLVYAYDELQKLNELSLRSPKEIFGEKIDFKNDPDLPHQDIMLKVCYRNSAPVLVTAHGLGFGIYRQGPKQPNLVTMFQEKELWTDVGYDVITGKLEFGENVELARDKSTSPDLITAKVPVKEILTFSKFSDEVSQYEWIAKEIEKNLNEDELEHKDIIVIHPEAVTSKSATAPLRSLLVKKGINCHLAGISTSQDDFFVDGSIAFTSIYRAKGNEAAMVYLMNAQYCFSGYQLIKKRNILFTAITRSKGWVRVCGIGPGMDGLQEEFKKIQENNYHLKFRYPTKEEMNHLNIIHRDLSGEELKKIEKGNDEAKSLLEKLENNEIKSSDLSQEIKDKLRKLLDED